MRGAIYNTQYMQIVGLGTITDSLASLKWNIFENQVFNFDCVLRALNADFEGHEYMRQIFLNKTPKYGNDDDYADNIARGLVDNIVEMVENHAPSPVRKASRRCYFCPQLFMYILEI